MVMRFAVWGVGAVALFALPLLIVRAQTVISETPSEEPITEAISAEVSSSNEPLPLEVDIASSSETATASSTEPVSQPEPVLDTRTVFIQTGVNINAHNQTGPVAATITVQNLTCRYCDTASSPVTIKAFYTEWLDNDGTDRINATSTARFAEQTFNIPAIDPWGSNSVEWQTTIENAGHYSFVVLVDPDNAIGARDTYRTEFFVD